MAPGVLQVQYHNRWRRRMELLGLLGTDLADSPPRRLRGQEVSSCLWSTPGHRAASTQTGTMCC